MGRAVVYRQRGSYRRGRRSGVVRESWHVGPNAFRFVVIAAVAVLSAMYIQTNAKNGQNDALLHQLNNQKNQLTDQLQALDVEAARASNTQNINDKAKNDLQLEQNASESKKINTEAK